MLSENQVFLELAQQKDYICIVELAVKLEASVSEVRHQLKALGDRVEYNDLDQWRIVRQIVVGANILSAAERRERDALENTVQQAFFVAGQALKLLRDKRLYRETHRTFQSYVRARFNFTRAAAYYLISATDVVNNLKCQQIVDTNKGTMVLPTKESQVRPLTKLTPERQREVWLKCVKLNEGRVPSARLVKQVLAEEDSNSRLEQKPEHQELTYKPGSGIDYTVHLDEETYRLFERYQVKIGSASKNGAIRRLIEDAIAE